MGIAKRAGVTVRVPRVQFTSDGYHKLDTPQAIGYFFLFGLSIIGLILIGSIVLFWGHSLYNKTAHPPKVITKVVYQTELQAAQKAFIDQCKQNTEHDSYNQGVPNVTVQPWTCTYAK